MPSLLTIDILYKDERDTPLDTLEDELKNIFSFNTFGAGFNTCLFKGVTGKLLGSM